MTADVVISAEGLGKSYMIGHASAGSERYTALRDVIARSARNLVRTTQDMVRGRQLVAGDTIEEFWALEDVSFEIKRSEVVGIIGRNGAGKSTLLKVLTRITEPTRGRVTLKGRVASLLEVGTGFHPELTGRENIFLNGAILGMTRAEIRRKFDEIVDFAGVERFLDTPVKRYSSGMYVRLAFAVAAHLESEILIVDEVLAVGDAEFQKKCLGKMQHVAGHGRTVLFVSHNMAAISTLCTRGLLLEGGRRVFAGEVAEALDRYNGGSTASLRLLGHQLEVSAQLVESTLGSGMAFKLQLDVKLTGPLGFPHLGVGITDSDGKRLATLLSETSCQLPPVREGESLSFRMTSEPVRFVPSVLYLKVALADHGKVVESYEDGLSMVTPSYWPFSRFSHVRPQGSIFLDHRIEFLELPQDNCACS